MTLFAKLPTGITHLVSWLDIRYPAKFADLGKNHTTFHAQLVFFVSAREIFKTLRTGFALSVKAGFT